MHKDWLHFRLHRVRRMRRCFRVRPALLTQPHLWILRPFRQLTCFRAARTPRIQTPSQVLPLARRWLCLFSLWKKCPSTLSLRSRRFSWTAGDSLSPVVVTPYITAPLPEDGSRHYCGRCCISSQFCSTRDSGVSTDPPDSHDPPSGYSHSEIHFYSKGMGASCLQSTSTRRKKIPT